MKEAKEEEGKGEESNQDLNVVMLGAGPTKVEKGRTIRTGWLLRWPQGLGLDLPAVPVMSSTLPHSEGGRGEDGGKGGEK